MIFACLQFAIGFDVLLDRTIFGNTRHERGRHQRDDLSQRCFVSSSGSFAIFAAIPRASSLVSNFAADRRTRLIFEIDVSELLSVVVAHENAGCSST